LEIHFSLSFFVFCVGREGGTWLLRGQGKAGGNRELKQLEIYGFMNEYEGEQGRGETA